MDGEPYVCETCFWWQKCTSLYPHGECRYHKTPAGCSCVRGDSDACPHWTHRDEEIANTNAVYAQVSALGDCLNRIEKAVVQLVKLRAKSKDAN